MSTDDKWEDLYNNYNQALRYLAMFYQVPYSDIDDVIQETFLSFFNLYSVDWTPKHIKAMLTKILRTKAIDCLRKHGRYDNISLDDCNSIENAELVTRYAAMNPLSIVLEKEFMKRIAAKMANMKPAYKEITILYFLEGRPISEICKILGITNTACRSRIFKTRMVLRTIFYLDF